MIRNENKEKLKEIALRLLSRGYTLISIAHILELNPDVIARWVDEL